MPGKTQGIVFESQKPAPKKPAFNKTCTKFSAPKKEVTWYWQPKQCTIYKWKFLQNDQAHLHQVLSEKEWVPFNDPCLKRRLIFFDAFKPVFEASFESSLWAFREAHFLEGKPIFRRKFGCWAPKNQFSCVAYIPPLKGFKQKLQLPVYLRPFTEFYTGRDSHCFHIKEKKLGGGFKCFFFAPLSGEDSHFD